MNEKEWSHLVKKIAKAKIVDWDKIQYDGEKTIEKDEYLTAMHAIDYMFCSDSFYFSGMLTISQVFDKELNSKEKHQFFSLFCDSEETALYYGQMNAFYSLKKILSNRYFFVFKRAFKKHCIFGCFSGVILSLLVLLCLLPTNLFLKCMVISGFVGYHFHILNKSKRLNVVQNDMILRELKNEMLQDTSQKLRTALCEEEWIEKEKNRTSEQQ